MPTHRRPPPLPLLPGKRASLESGPAQAADLECELWPRLFCAPKFRAPSSDRRFACTWRHTQLLYLKWSRTI
eukprot:4914905-Pyramimonas_sp.AAC.1